MDKLEAGDVVRFKDEEVEYLIIEHLGDRINVKPLYTTMNFIPIETSAITYVESCVKARELTEEQRIEVERIHPKGDKDEER